MSGGVHRVMAALGLAGLALALGALPAAARARARKAAPIAAGPLPVYRLRPDLRSCPAPACGGFFLSALNQARTKCADGSVAAECYVASLEPAAAGGPSTEAIDALASAPASERGFFRGRIEPRRAMGAPARDVLAVSGAWRPAGSAAGEGAYYEVKDASASCAKASCASIRASLLNDSASKLVSGVELAPSKASPADLERASDAMEGDGILVFGGFALGAGPDDEVLVGSQLYLPLERRTPPPTRR